MATAADASGVVVGYCIMLRAADEAEIANIATAPGARRRGIGARLLDDAIAAAGPDAEIIDLPRAEGAE
jgi:ribosomal protein S18 acetylase RimI-like enzyme